MRLYAALLGKSTVALLEVRQSAAVLVIGSDRFTRAQLSRVGCFNFVAAARLSTLLTLELEVKDTKDLFSRVGPHHLALPGLGAISLATIGAAFEIMKCGTLEDYVARHRQKGDQVVTFATMKTNIEDQKAASKEKREKKQRARARRRQAHELRVERHLTKHATH